MSTKIIDIEGVVKYIHAVNLNKYGNWSITMIPNDKGLQALDELKKKGLKNFLKLDDDGAKYMQFNRPPQKLMKGKMVAFQAPRILLHNPEDPERPKLIDGNTVGWGSTGICRLECYAYGPVNNRAVAARWDSLKVTSLIQFDVDKSDWSDEEKDNAKSLGAVPEPEPW